MFSTIFASTWHELVFGTLLANVFLLIGTMRYMYRITNRYRRKVKHFFEKIDILWFEYGSTNYPGLSALEIHNKLNKELEEYVDRSE